MIKRIGNIYGDYDSYDFAGNVYDVSGICPTLKTCQGGGMTPMILIEYGSPIKF